MLDNLKRADFELHAALKNELQRQRNGIELIASENFVSLAVLEALGTVLTNKYSEGYPKKRYYAGNEFIDIAEQLAIDRVKQLFGAEHANVQPHAGSQANMAAFFALLKLNDAILGMDMAHGGHLTHGSPVNFSGKHYHFSSYGVDPITHLINMDEVEEIAQKTQPKMLLAGFSAYPRQLDFKKFKKIADGCSALLMADIAHIAGIIAAKLHPDPIPYCDVITSTTHKTLRGPRGAFILCKEIHAKAIDKAIFPGMQGGPLDHVIAAKAVAFKEALQKDFIHYQEQVLRNAKVLAQTLMNKGIDLISNGTDNHLVLINLSNTKLCTKDNKGGKEVETALDTVGMYTNKNMIPFDKRSPFNPSGIRLGTPALTTRGFKEDEMKQVGEIIANIINNFDAFEDMKIKIIEQVNDLTQKHPLYLGLEY